MDGIQDDDDVMSEENIAVVDSVNECMTINSKPAAAVPKTRKRNLTSGVWVDFTLVEQDDGS